MQRKKNLDWRGLFQWYALRDAQRILDNNGVTIFYVYDDERSCNAQVETGRQKYKVNIQRAPKQYSDSWDNAIFTCTCPQLSRYSRRKDYCEHIAAVMLRWEKQHGPWVFYETEAEALAREARERRRAEDERRRREMLEKKTSRMRALSFLKKHEKTKKEGSFFRLSDILKGINTNQYYEEVAEEILENGDIRVSELSCEFLDDFGEVINYTGRIQYYEDSFTTQIQLEHDGLHKISCSCGECAFPSYYYNRSELCAHVLVGLLKIQEYIEKEDPGDYTDLSAMRFFSEMDAGSVERRELVPEGFREEKHPVTIMPRLTEDADGMKLSYKIGHDNGKMYVVRSLHDLTEAVSQEGKLALGKSDELDFSVMEVDEKSRPWLSLIMRRVQEMGEVNRRLQNRSWSYVAPLNATAQQELKGALLDSFYDAAEGTRVDYQHRSSGSGGMLSVGHVPLKLKLKTEPLHDAEGNFAGIRLFGDAPLMLEGADSVYLCTEKNLSRLEKEERDILKPFNTSIEDHYFEISIGKNLLQEFYFRVVPRFLSSRFIELEDTCAHYAEELLPPEPEFEFRLDLEEGILTLSESVRYDHTVIRLPEYKKEPAALRASFRDYRQEDRVERVILEYFEKPRLNSLIYAMDCSSDEVLFKTMNEIVPTLSAYGTVLGSEAFSQYRIRPVPQVRVGVSLESGLMDLDFTGEDVDIEELFDVLDSYRKRKRYHRLKNGDFVSFTTEKGLEDLDDFLKETGLSEEEIRNGHASLPVYRALYVNRLLEEHEALSDRRDRSFRALVRNFRTIADSEFEPPADIASKLRPYQVYGYKWLRTLYEFNFGGILADEMGLGKTVQMIALFEEASDLGRKTGTKRPHLVVCPASLVYNWKEELSRFAPSLTVTLIEGTAGRRKIMLEDEELFQNTDVFVTSYDLLKKDILNYETLHFDIAVLDEAQVIKNQRSAVSKSVRVLTADHRYALTGTPIENRLSELHSIFDFLMPGYLYRYETFLSTFETPIVKNKDEKAAERLKKMVSPFILRRLKSEVLKDLPAKLEEVRYARLMNEQQKLYDAQVLRMKQMISEDTGSGEGKIRIFAELTRIREICCDPSLLYENFQGTSAKREACLDLIKSAIEGGHRMLVFSQFTSMLALLSEDLDREGISYYTIIGATPKEERLKLVHAFNEEETVPVFLISLKAGGTGLNLTGADVVIHYDPWWNIAVQNQATDRAHRIGQTREVSVFKLIAKDTIEEKILELQEAKQELADAILSGEQQSLMSLSKEELLELLS